MFGPTSLQDEKLAQTSQPGGDSLMMYDEEMMSRAEGRSVCGGLAVPPWCILGTGGELMCGLCDGASGGSPGQTSSFRLLQPLVNRRRHGLRVGVPTASLAALRSAGLEEGFRAFSPAAHCKKNQE